MVEENTLLNIAETSQERGGRKIKANKSFLPVTVFLTYIMSVNVQRLVFDNMQQQHYIFILEAQLFVCHS